MENQETQEIIKPKHKDTFVGITVTQCICTVLILLSVLVTKFFFKDTYNAVKQWYSQNVLVDTDINQVLSEGEENEI